MSPKCGRGAEKFIQGKKKGPARSPEAKTVILAESYSKIWKGLWAIWADGAPAPGPPELLSKLPFCSVTDSKLSKGLATRRTWGSADFYFWAGAGAMGLASSCPTCTGYDPPASLPLGSQPISNL